MNKLLFKKFINCVGEIFNNSIHDCEILESKFYELFDELRLYCAESPDVLDCYRLIRLLEKEIKFLIRSHHPKNNQLSFGVTKITDALKVEKEIIGYRISNPKIQIFKGRNHTKSPVNLKWTDSKIALVELIYAIAKSFNHGNTSISEVARAFECCFQVELGNYYDILSDINLRKDPAKFLHSLIRNLNETLDRLNSK